MSKASITDLYPWRVKWIYVKATFSQRQGLGPSQPRGRICLGTFCGFLGAVGSIDTWQSFACALGPGAKCREGWAEGGVTWFQSEISEIWPCFDESDLLLVVLIQYCGPLFLLNSHGLRITLILAEQIWKLYLYTSHSRRKRIKIQLRNSF